MIFDSLENIRNYQEITEVYTALQHLAILDPALPLGVYPIVEGIVLHVTEYETKIENPNRYEAHRLNIDVQYPLTLGEIVEWAPLDRTSQVQAYDKAKDRTYHTLTEPLASLQIGEGLFAVFFPEDAHNPCLAVDGISQLIKKATYKIQISLLEN